MTQYLNLSRAARLAGVSRREIQKKLQAGELKTFEGDVQITDLLRVFPKIDLDHDPTIEQIERIKADASPKFPWQQNEPPSVEILLARLQTLSGLLIETKSALDRNAALVKSLDHRLAEIKHDESLNREARNQITNLHDWLLANRDAQDVEPDDAAILFTRNLLLHIIAPSVQILPSGHEFLAEGGDTILDGAIRSGLNVIYGCNDTTCGGCKARLISGQVLERQTPDYVLSNQERRMGYMLMCCNAAVTDLVIEAGETLSPTDLPEQTVKSSVSNLQPLSEDRFLLRLKAPEGQNFRFCAGQKATLTLADGDARTLPIFSCPCDRENLHFVIEKNRNDAASEAFFSGLGQGALVTITGPEGNFVLHDASANPSLFIACGDGFIAIKSLIEHAISIDRIEAFHIYRYAAPNSPDHYHNLCRSWRDALDNFTYKALEISGDANAEISSINGDISDLKNFDAYVAGPRAFTEAHEKALIDHGLPTGRLRVEITSD